MGGQWAANGADPAVNQFSADASSTREIEKTSILFRVHSPALMSSVFLITSFGLFSFYHHVAAHQLSFIAICSPRVWRNDSGRAGMYITCNKFHTC